jgi:opacity protein-like surface antigen
VKQNAVALLLVSAALLGQPAQARVFNYKESSVAPYLRATGGLSSVHQAPFENSSGAGTSINGSTKFDYSGELGVMLALSENAHVRIGAEVIQHRPVSEAAGLNATGGQRFALDSSVSAFNPNLTLEFVVKPGAGSTRYFGLVGVGMADVTVENKYRMTVLGASELGGVSDYTEKLSGKGIEGHLGVGLETVFTDNVTCALDVGYRYLPIKSLKYKSDVNTILIPSGAHKGDDVLNADGSKRKVDLGGPIIGISFRFYLNFI